MARAEVQIIIIRQPAKPYDNPVYSIVVMTEDGTSGATDCGPIFRTIVENIEE